MTIDLDTTLAQAEVLFLSFAQLVADTDRRRAEQASSSSSSAGAAGDLRRRHGSGTNGPSPAAQSGSALTEPRKTGVPQFSEELRELLRTDR
jgi:TBC1 domain family member 15